MPQNPPGDRSSQLRDLAGRFTALHHEIRTLAWGPGTDALAKNGPLVARAQSLTTATLARLTALNADTISRALPGSSTRSTIASAAFSAACAVTDLTAALMENPYDASPFAGHLAPTQEERRARHSEARTIMAEHLADAAHQLDAGAICLHYAAGSTGTRHPSPDGPKAGRPRVPKAPGAGPTGTPRR
ncbi:hypothetical protein OG711_08040 [Streptomyces uncialis]|uniref:hypothetical protein n=1 Tax=Streptomyces uncialis TaxID=1048205 RepID=UPI002E32075C|nr:hypothetical protein [Streptomyces uncialis]